MVAPDQNAPPPAPDTNVPDPRPFSYLEKEPTADLRKAEHDKEVAAAGERIKQGIKEAFLPSASTIDAGRNWLQRHGTQIETLAFPVTAPAMIGAEIGARKLREAMPQEGSAPPPTDLEAKRAVEAQAGVMAPAPSAAVPETEVPAPKKAMAGGGVGGYAAPSGPSPLERDFNERIGAMGEEEVARGQMARDVAGAYGGVEEQGRQNAEEQAVQARDATMRQRAKIAEVDQLNRDYMNRTIDPDRFWNQAGVGQKIGMVLGSMFAGLSGGAEGSRNYVNDIINRDLDAQKFQIDNQYKGTMTAQNLLGSLQRTSDSEQEATDKARAALYGAAMVEVARAGAAAKGPVEEAQVRELIADMKATRDASLAKLAAQRAAATAQSGLGLEVTGDDLIQGPGGQQFLTPDKSWADPARNAMLAYDRMEQALKDGISILKDRGVSDVIPGNQLWSGNLQRGKNAYGEVLGTASKMEGARGVPNGIENMVKDSTPDFSSPLVLGTKGNIEQAEAALRRVQLARQYTLRAANARPVEVQAGPGTGKKANELTYRVTRIGQPVGSGAAAAEAGPRPPPGFQPQ